MPDNISKGMLELPKQLFSNPWCNITRHESSVDNEIIGWNVIIEQNIYKVLDITP